MVPMMLVGAFERTVILSLRKMASSMLWETMRVVGL